MTDDFDGIGWREYMRGIENGNIDPTGERLRAVCKLAREALAATPAVGGEALPTYGSLPWDQLGLDVNEAMTGERFAFQHSGYPGHSLCPINFNSLARIVDKYRLAAQPASPLRGMEDLAPSPWSDLSIGELIEWLDNPQWTNGYLNSDAANHMSAAAELIERLVSSIPPEQPAADPVTGRDEAIEEAAKIAQPWAGFWLNEYSTNADRAVVAVRIEIAEKIRALKSSTVPAKPSFGEPIREDNYMSNDLDKGSDA